MSTSVETKPGQQKSLADKDTTEGDTSESDKTAKQTAHQFCHLTRGILSELSVLAFCTPCHHHGHGMLS